MMGPWWVCQSPLCRRRGNLSLQRAEAGGGHGRTGQKEGGPRESGGGLEGEILGGVLATRRDFRKHQILWRV